MMTRRYFLYSSLLCAASVLRARERRRYAIERPLKLLSAELQTIASVHTVLFPTRASVPTLAQINAVGYLAGVLHDPLIAADERAFLTDGARWLDEECHGRHGSSFGALSAAEREAMIDQIVQSPWGESWVWYLLAYLFEAALGDPVYGGNARESGWKWLGHAGGIPRPKEPLHGTL